MKFISKCTKIPLKMCAIWHVFCWGLHVFTVDASPLQATSTTWHDTISCNLYTAPCVESHLLTWGSSDVLGLEFPGLHDNNGDASHCGLVAHGNQQLSQLALEGTRKHIEKESKILLPIMNANSIALTMELAQSGAKPSVQWRDSLLETGIIMS